jgi:CIC family chloride channel protein
MRSSERAARVAWLARFGAALILTSALSASFAVAMRIALEAATTALFGGRDVVSGLSRMSMGVRAVTPALGAVLGAAVTELSARFPAARGVGDVMEAVVLGQGRVSLRAALAKALASSLALLGGGSVGREGPLIQVGAALGGTTARVLGLDALSVRVLYAAGTAAGFAAAYNTPIAATLFVVEIVAGVAALELVVPVGLAAGLATALARHVLGDAPLYGTHPVALVSTRELLASTALGPLGGVVGAAFMYVLAESEALASRAVRSRIARASLGGVGVGLLATVAPEIVGNGAGPIGEMLDGRVLGGTFFVLLALKPIATSLSVGTGSAGGVFTPSMFLGAALGGGLASVWLGGEGADHAPLVAAFALVGMASTIAATTHAPLMASALAFELAGDYALVVPLLLATSLAVATSRVWSRDSIYAAELRRRKVEWDRSLATAFGSGTTVMQAATGRSAAPPSP